MICSTRTEDIIPSYLPSFTFDRIILSVFGVGLGTKYLLISCPSIPQSALLFVAVTSRKSRKKKSSTNKFLISFISLFFLSPPFSLHLFLNHNSQLFSYFSLEVIVMTFEVYTSGIHVKCALYNVLYLQQKVFPLSTSAL